MPQKTHADIPGSFLEYVANYREPAFGPLKLHEEIFKSALLAFRPWNVSLQNVVSNQSPRNFSEIWTSFALLGGRLAFSIGLGTCRVFVTNPDWSEVSTLIQIASAGLGALKSAGGIEIETQRASIGMHLKPAGGSIKKFVLEFAKPAAATLLAEDVQAVGISIYRQDSTWVVDKSVVYPEALFVKIDRSFRPAVGLDEIARVLKQEEDELLGMLNLEID